MAWAAPGFPTASGRRRAGLRPRVGRAFAPWHSGRPTGPWRRRARWRPVPTRRSPRGGHCRSPRPPPWHRQDGNRWPGARMDRPPDRAARPRRSPRGRGRLGRDRGRFAYVVRGAVVALRLDGQLGQAQRPGREHHAEHDEQGRPAATAVRTPATPLRPGPPFRSVGTTRAARGLGSIAPPAASAPGLGRCGRLALRIRFVTGERRRRVVAQRLGGGSASGAGQGTVEMPLTRVAVIHGARRLDACRTT